jgi:hypothetical protein
VFDRSVVRDGSTVTTSVLEVLAPLARFPIVQVTVPAESVPPPDAETKLVPAGNGSEAVTPVASAGPSFEISIVYVRSLPAITGSGESDFVTDRSAEDASDETVVVSVAVSLLESGSEVVALTVAVLDRSATCPASTFTVRVREVLVPAARAPIVQVTLPAASVPPPDAETNVVPAGIGSETVTPAASDGPLFVMPIVYVRSLPATTGSGESDFVMERSAEVFTVVVSVSELSLESGSEVVALAVAVLDRSAVLDGSTFTVNVREMLAPAASAPIVQVTVPAESVPPPEADTKVVPAGKGSAIETPTASDEPLFVMPIV